MSVCIKWCPEIVFNLYKADTGLDREYDHPLQLNTVKPSNCTPANPGVTGHSFP